jgi:hypothetical protein
MIKAFLDYFHYLDEFTSLNSDIMLKMGIEHLEKKTQVFGNNPRVLRNADEEKNQLNGLIEASKSEEINKYNRDRRKKY